MAEIIEINYIKCESITKEFYMSSDDMYQGITADSILCVLQDSIGIIVSKY
jgi:hypothetical protein